MDFPCNGLDWKRDLKEEKKTVFTKFTVKTFCCAFIIQTSVHKQETNFLNQLGSENA